MKSQNIEQSKDYLKILSIFHYIMGALIGLIGLLPIIHIVLGIVLLVSPPEDLKKDEPMGLVIGIIFIVAGLFVILIAWAFAAALIYAGKCLSNQKHHTTCLVIACISCLSFPFGTVLGVFSIILLLKPEVKALFK